MLENNLQLGDTGNDVKILQEKLKILGFYNAIITGSFGLATEEGVKAFQKEYKLAETGVVDNEMWKMLFQFTETAITPFRDYPILKLGSRGKDVEELQKKLKALLHYTGNITGIFDLETENAVKRFQLNNDLTTTGIVNNQTWTYIDMLYGSLNPCVKDEEDTDTDTISYTVIMGDSLWSIAKKYNTTVDAIKKLNNLTSNTVRIGQVLKIPVNNIDENYVNYTVINGDTLYSIAKKYNTTVDAIKNLNNLTSNTLSIGQVLKIPVDNTDNNYINYIVVNGDSLWAIAKKYNTTVENIKRLNSLTSDTLSIGQTLKIPVSNIENNYTTYTVVSGDTLYSIARKYNTTIDAIKNLNNLTSNTLSIGQVLKIKI